jgi:hypothetical protein
MNNHGVPLGPGGVPDLGAIQQPQQVQVALSALLLRLPQEATAQGLVDAVTLVALMREAIREDLREIVGEIVRRELRTLLTDEELTEAEQVIDQSYLEALTKAGLEYRAPASELFQQGVELRKGSVVFEPHGFAYGSFRYLPWPLPTFAAGRTVMLLRDPRDALTSLYFSIAYSHRPPGSAQGQKLLRKFEARRADARAGSIDGFVLREAPGHLRAIEKTMANLPAHRLYRYEDVIFDKLAWTHDMLDFLKLDVPGRLVEAVVARNDIVPDAEAPLEHIRHVTPGDHRNKLQPQTIEALNELFGRVMGKFGYGFD